MLNNSNESEIHADYAMEWIYSEENAKYEREFYIYGKRLSGISIREWLKSEGAHGIHKSSTVVFVIPSDLEFPTTGLPYTQWPLIFDTFGSLAEKNIKLYYKHQDKHYPLYVVAWRRNPKGYGLYANGRLIVNIADDTQSNLAIEQLELPENSVIQYVDESNEGWQTQGAFSVPYFSDSEAYKRLQELANEKGWYVEAVRGEARIKFGI